LEEARFATLFARNAENKKRFLSAEEIIRTATLGGAAALGLEDKIGTLQTEKQADVIVVSLNDFSQMPVHNIYSALLFASNARDVCLTMVAGMEIYRDGKLKNIDEREIKIMVKKIIERM
jgi:5-methylthioadenosine/S-adenosylhomocysteine deaminase